jgi:hypothetical protein
MSAEPPIACSLSATELPARLAAMAALGASALVDARSEPRRAELRFAAGDDDGDGVRERVDAIVAAESSCCAFLTMSVSEEDGLVVLAIDAPEGAEVVLEGLVAAFRNQPTAGC